MNEHDAVQALEELGLTNYEAKVFIALQRIGTGSARDVARVSDVPRPQVYSTAESLEDRGLVDVQQSDPIRYRPVSIEEAKARLRNRFERTQDQAFEFIEDISQTGSENERQEDIWTVSGRDTITERITHLIGAAQVKVLYAIDSVSLIGPETVGALQTAAGSGIDVTVLSRNAGVKSSFADVDGVTVVDHAVDDHGEVAGRLLIVDDETVLLSAFGEETSDGRPETAIWSGETDFAQVLIRLVKRQL